MSTYRMDLFIYILQNMNPNTTVYWAEKLRFQPIIYRIQLFMQGHSAQ